MHGSAQQTRFPSVSRNSRLFIFVARPVNFVSTRLTAEFQQPRTQGALSSSLERGPWVRGFPFAKTFSNRYRFSLKEQSGFSRVSKSLPDWFYSTACFCCKQARFILIVNGFRPTNSCQAWYTEFNDEEFLVMFFLENAALGVEVRCLRV